MRAIIAGTGGYLPERALSNEELAQAYGLDTSDEWIRERTGIRQRHIAAEGETASSMGAAAALRALEQAGIAAADWIGRCTYGDPARFFSYRRATHAGEPDYGRLLSAIRL